jgi:hypothetical protein
MTVVWSAGAPKLVLKGSSAQLHSQMGLSRAAGPLHRSGRSIGGRGLIVGRFWRPLKIAVPKLRKQVLTPIALLLVFAATVILALTTSPN